MKFKFLFLILISVIFLGVAASALACTTNTNCPTNYTCQPLSGNPLIVTLGVTGICVAPVTPAATCNINANCAPNSCWWFAGTVGVCVSVAPNLSSPGGGTAASGSCTPVGGVCGPGNYNCCSNTCNDNGVTNGTCQAASTSSTAAPTGFSVTLANPLCPAGSTSASCINSIPSLLGAIMTFVLYIVTSLAVIIFIYAGFLYLTSAGNESKLNQAKQALIYGIIGVAIALAAGGLLAVIQAVIPPPPGTTTSSGAGCTPGNPGTVQYGASCSSDSDCVSCNCVNGTCGSS